MPASAQSAARRPIQAPAEVQALRTSAPSTAVSNGPAKDMLAAPVTAESIVAVSCFLASEEAAAPPMVANAACGCTLKTGKGKAREKGGPDDVTTKTRSSRRPTKSDLPHE